MKKDIGAHRPVMTTLFEKILSGDILHTPWRAVKGGTPSSISFLEERVIPWLFLIVVSNGLPT